MTRLPHVARACLVALAATVLVLPARLAAQRQAELHANYSRGTTTKANAWGAGTQFQMVVGKKSYPLNIGTSLGFDWLKQEQGGPNQYNVSYDAALQPGGGQTVTPYAGGSVGANWSTGQNAAWSGARLGLETIGGFQIKTGSGSSAPSVKLEERFGYVRGQEHTLTSRFGVDFSI